MCRRRIDIIRYPDADEIKSSIAKFEDGVTISELADLYTNSPCERWNMRNSIAVKLYRMLKRGEVRKAGERDIKGSLHTVWKNA